MVCLQVFVEALRGLGKNLEVMEDGILYHLIGKKRLLPTVGIPRDPSVHSLMWSR